MKTSAVLVSPSGKSPFVVGQGTGYLGRTLLRKFARKLDTIFSEGVIGRLVFRPYVSVATDCANATVTLASVADGDALTLNGQAITAGTGTTGNNQFDDSLASDTLVAGDLVRAINASTTSLISGHVGATNKQAIVTLASVVTGDTVTIDGVVLTARTGTAAVLTGLLTGEFSINGTDTQDGDSFCLAVNQHPTLSQRVYAKNASGVVTIYERPPSTGQTIPISSSNGTRLAITGSATALAASAVVFVESILPGLAGNAVTIAVGSHMTIGGSVSRLAGGTSTTYTY